MNNLNIREARKRVIRRILRIVRPHTWESGYCKDSHKRIIEGDKAPTEYVRIWMPTKGKVEWISMPRNLMITQFLGITENGVITDAHVGMVTTFWRAIPIEDLNRIHSFISKRLDWTLF